MYFGIATQIFIVIVTLRVTKSSEHEKDINLKKTSGPDINTNSYVNQDDNLMLKGDVSVDGVHTARPNVSADGHPINNATINETNVQLQTQSSSTTSNKTEFNKVENVTGDIIKEGEVNSTETDCKTGYCNKQNNGTEEKNTTKRENLKNSYRKHGAKWNPPRNYIGPETQPTDDTIDSSKLDIGPEEQYNLRCGAIGNSRFNPYSMLNEKLFAFYIWGPVDAEKTIEFTVPSSKVFSYIRKRVETYVETPIKWENRHFMMVDHRYNYSSVLVENGPNGRYCMYPFVRKAMGMVYKHDLHAQFKQSADGKYLLMVLCDTKIASGFLFSRYKHIPRSKKIASIAAMMGVSGHKGKSYLYQGHHWLPVDEMDELEYWALEYGRVMPEALPEKGFSRDEEFAKLIEPLPEDSAIPTLFPFRVDL